MRFDDTSFVRHQYATEAGLAARVAVYGSEGNEPHELLLDELRRLAPARVLEVGCGWGALAQRITDEVGCEVVAVDLSPRMVELARARGVDAVEGDVQALEFGDGVFDAVVAAWMLYHVPDLDLAVREIARVLGPGGVLVAVTNGDDDLAELWELVGRERIHLSFRGENGEEILRRGFSDVKRQDVRVPVTFADGDVVRSYVGSSELGRPYVDAVPELDEPLVATKTVSVFVATK